MEEDYDMHDELDADVSPEDAVFTLHSQPIPIHLHKELSKGARHAIANKIKKAGGDPDATEEEARVIICRDNSIASNALKSKHAHDRYKFVETPGWVDECIYEKRYRHIIDPKRQRFNGYHKTRAGRVPFTAKDKESIVDYLYLRLPFKEIGCRTGQVVWKELCNPKNEERYPWAKRHTWQSWREQYKNNSGYYDQKIEAKFHADLDPPVRGGQGQYVPDFTPKGGARRRGVAMEEEEEEEEEELEAQEEAQDEGVGEPEPRVISTLPKSPRKLKQRPVVRQVAAKRSTKQRPTERNQSPIVDFTGMEEDAALPVPDEPAPQPSRVRHEGPTHPPAVKRSKVTRASHPPPDTQATLVQGPSSPIPEPRMTRLRSRSASMKPTTQLPPLGKPPQRDLRATSKQGRAKPRGKFAHPQDPLQQIPEASERGRVQTSSVITNASAREETQVENLLEPPRTAKKGEGKSRARDDDEDSSSGESSDDQRARELLQKTHQLFQGELNLLRPRLRARKRAHTTGPPRPPSLPDSSISSSEESVPVPDTNAYEHKGIREKRFTPAKGTKAEAHLNNGSSITVIRKRAKK